MSAFLLVPAHLHAGWRASSGQGPMSRRGALAARPAFLRLLRVELDDVLLGDLRRDVLAGRLGLHLRGEALLVDLEPLRDATAIDCLQRLADADHLAAALLDGDEVADAH